MSVREVAYRCKRWSAAVAWRVTHERAFGRHLSARGLSAVRPFRWSSWAPGVRLYLARDRAGDQVMVKVLHHASMAELEARGLRRLHQRGCSPEVLDCAIAPRPYVVLQYRGPDDLTSYLERSTDAEMTGLAERLIGIVDALHDASLVHRDVRPANLLVEGAGDTLTMLLIDFANSIDPTSDDGIDMVRVENVKTLDVLGDAYRAAGRSWDDAASALMILERDLGPRMERAQLERCADALRARVGRFAWAP